MMPVRRVQLVCLLTLITFLSDAGPPPLALAATDDPAESPPAERSDTERARDLIEEARSNIQDADDPENEEHRATLQDNARQLIEEARTLFEAALAEHRTEFRQFPLVIPEGETVRRRERDAAEQRYLRSKLNSAEIAYYEAMTYDRGSEQRDQALENAIDGFSGIHQAHRSQIIGLIARMWQGKCFQERNMIREALGIFNEILGHPGTTDSMQVLQARARRFRLICLNHERRRDYRLVVAEALEWREQAGDLAHTDVGMGILFEVAQPQEKLGMDRSIPQAERSEYLNAALNNARAISRHEGELQAPSLALVQRVSAALNPDDED